MAKNTRREFCLGCAGALLIGCGPGGSSTVDLGPPRDLRPALINAGPASALASGAAILTGEGSVYLCRDAGGLFAVTSVCTHAGCEVGFRANPARFACPCHGSEYTFDGVVTQGPANANLEHYAVSIDTSGDAIIDPGQTVAASVRT
jgi:Rieske Fe-S protein